MPFPVLRNNRRTTSFPCISYLPLKTPYSLTQIGICMKIIEALCEQSIKFWCHIHYNTSYYLLCGIRLLMKRTPPNGTSQITESLSTSTSERQQKAIDRKQTTSLLQNKRSRWRRQAVKAQIYEPKNARGSKPQSEPFSASSCSPLLGQ